MERELKRAAEMVKITKEKINFGIITVNDIGELSFNLKIDYFPALIAIK